MDPLYLIAVSAVLGYLAAYLLLRRPPSQSTCCFPHVAPPSPYGRWFPHDAPRSVSGRWFPHDAPSARPLEELAPWGAWGARPPNTTMGAPC